MVGCSLLGSRWDFGATVGSDRPPVVDIWASDLIIDFLFGWMDA